MVAETAVRAVNLIAVVMLSAAYTSTVFQLCFIEFEATHTTFHNGTALKLVLKK
jgi:hypothetical protein